MVANINLIKKIKLRKLSFSSENSLINYFVILKNILSTIHVLETMIMFLLVFLSIYIPINYYIIRRTRQSLEFFPKYVKLIITLFIIFWASGYPISKIIDSWNIGWFYDVLTFFGALWFIIMTYTLLSLLLVDIIRLFLYVIKKKPDTSSPQYPKHKMALGIITVLLVTIITIIGYQNAHTIEVTKLQISIPAKSSKMDSLRIVFFSDSHFSTINDESFFELIKEKTETLNYDIIILGGDVIDTSPHHLKRHNIDSLLSTLDAPLGVYSVEGNHEYIVDIEKSISFLEKNGISIIRDSAIIIASSFVLAGRRDYSAQRFNSNGRKALSEIMIAESDSLPTILIDHQPFGLSSAEQNNIDLQLSGHTHDGQFFPINLFVKWIYEKSHGYLKKGNTQYYISSGVGTWGPPVRIGTIAEVVYLEITFVKE